MGVKVFCKNCGKLNEKVSAFCMECGKPMAKGGTMKMQTQGSRCPKCGLAVPADKKFCNKCGASVTGTGEFPPGRAEADGSAPLVDASAVRQCRACGTVNYEFEFCLSCGQGLAPGAAQAAEPDGRSTSGRRRICSSCLGFHPIEAVSEFDGKHYCQDCIRNVQL